MALTKITTNVIADDAITSDKISDTVNLSGPKIANVQYADASFTALDDTAANTSGTARLVINGEGFESGVIVIVGTTEATSTTLVNSTQLRANVTAMASGSYPIYVQNLNGSTAIKVNGVTFSNTPVWGTAATLSNQAANTSFNVSISATSDSSVTYSNTTALPAGTQLLSNGYFYGTVTIGVETNYSFGVKATDAENQDDTRTFSLTVTVTPLYQLWTWGFNNNGQLGQNDLVNKSSPVQVGSGTDWNKISIGTYNTITTKTDGTLWTWGVNNYGQLGFNDTVNRSSPVQVGSGTTWDKVSTGTYNFIATKTDGTLWTWGWNNSGALGLNDQVNRSSPTQVGSNNNWKLISAGYYNMMATKTDGTLWLWGDNYYGQLGLGTNLNSKSSPTQVGGLIWDKITIGLNSAMATRTDGTLWSWGRNSKGQLGQNDSISYKKSPIQVGTDTNWNLISTRSYSSTATKTNGTIWTWGHNNNGQLGLGDTVPRSSPTQIGSGTNWNLVSIGAYNTISTKTDGTIWTWGHNNNGQLGLGNIVNRSSPVQVGTGTNWNLVSIGSYNTIATKTA